MVDVDKRGTAANEVEPSALNIAVGHAGNFNMGAQAARSYQDLLRQGISAPSPGAPVPVEYPGGQMLADPRPGLPTAATGYGDGDSDDNYAEAREEVAKQPVVQGMHSDPRASLFNVGNAYAVSGSNVKPAQGFPSVGVTVALSNGQKAPAGTWAASEWMREASEVRR